MTSVVTRDVFFISDSTGITAETLGNSLLAQFEGNFVKHRVPFVTDNQTAHDIVLTIESSAKSGRAPILFLTIVTPEIREIFLATDAVAVDFVEDNLQTLERSLGQSASRHLGRFHSITDSDRYRDRMGAVEFALEHDDGESVKALGLADVILVAPSRCGKTPTTMYLAVNYGVRAANVPLLEEDLLAQALPASVQPFVDKVFGLISTPQRLHQVRQERRPNSVYSSLQQCSFEVNQAETLFVSQSIPYVDSSQRSIEELSAIVLGRLGLSGKGG
jgi:[pyruvate, water dikinase]-phosphate phosphotransferase / [pyruvate, water dikinase] kinase